MMCDLKHGEAKYLPRDGGETKESEIDSFAPAKRKRNDWKPAPNPGTTNVKFTTHVGSAKKRAKLFPNKKRIRKAKTKEGRKFQAKLCRIAEKMIQSYLARTGDTSKQPVQVSYKDVVMGEHLTPEQEQVARAMVQTYEDIFMKSPDDTPPILKVDPVEWMLKEGVKPVRCRRPSWGPAQRAFLKHWTQKALDQGLIVSAGHKSVWASRPVLVVAWDSSTCHVLDTKHREVHMSLRAKVTSI